MAPVRAVAAPALARQLAARTRLVLLLDFDGTLVPIAPTPAAVRIPSGARALVRALARQPGVMVGLISGRSLRDVKRRMGVSGVIYAGNHGLEIAGPGWRFVHPQARRFQARLRRLAGELRRALRAIPGVAVEWKQLTISVHWRRVPRRLVRRVRALVASTVAAQGGRRAVRLTDGKCVAELRPPVAWDKGAAVAWIAGRLGLVRRPAQLSHPSEWSLVYVGDDQTDEDAFRVVNRLGGISVCVGQQVGATAARYRLRDPRALRQWLRDVTRAVRVERRAP